MVRPAIVSLVAPPIVNSVSDCVFQEVVGGFVITPECNRQLHHVFSRVVYALRSRYQQPTSPTSPRIDSDDGDKPDCSIQQWLNGAKVEILWSLTRSQAVARIADRNASQQTI